MPSRPKAAASASRRYAGSQSSVDPIEKLFDDKVIAIRGAREHNLKNIDLTIPRDKLVVFTGLSGSGKSSLAFDTIYAEGQRRYVESLSAYARQFLEMMGKPDVDQIDGLSPAISIEQKTTSKNPRSTVGTVTEIYDYMRLLWARTGIPYSPATGLPIESQTVSQMVDRVLALPERTRFYLVAPVVRGRKGEYRKEIADFQKRGFQRLKIDGEFYAIDEAPTLDKKLKHDIGVVVDRIAVRPDMATRLAESFETALDLADGIALVELADPVEGYGKEITFSSKFACPVSGFTISEIEPRLFSFNNPFGACPTCAGLGSQMKVDPERVVPDGRLSLQRGAIAPWAKSTSPYYGQTLDAITRHFGAKMNTPWNTLPEEVRDTILFGSGKTEIKFTYNDGNRTYSVTKPFEGVVRNLDRRFKETDSEWAREEISRYMGASPCPACNGARLKPEALGRESRWRDDRGHLGPVDHRRQSLVRSPAGKARRQAQRDCCADPQGDPRPAHLSARRRPRLSDAGANRRHPFGRGEPAHPPRVADRLGADGRPVCARRALDRPASARQRATARYASSPPRPGQQRHRGGARRRRHPGRRLCRGRRAWRRHPRGRDRLGRHA